MKKILLSLGAMAAVTAPVATVVACSNEKGTDFTIIKNNLISTAIKHVDGMRSGTTTEYAPEATIKNIFSTLDVISITDINTSEEKEVYVNQVGVPGKEVANGKLYLLEKNNSNNELVEAYFKQLKEAGNDKEFESARRLLTEENVDKYFIQEVTVKNYKKVDDKYEQVGEDHHLFDTYKIIKNPDNEIKISYVRLFEKPTNN